MSDHFLGEIRLFGFGFVPRGWAPCEGQILPISDHSALYSLMGTTFGGNGQTTFGLPDLRGRVPVHPDPESVPNPQGKKGGVERVSLTADTIPAHSHNVMAYNGDEDGAIQPGDKLISKCNKNIYAEPNDTIALSEETISSTGWSDSHSNIQPCLAVNFCIALDGTYPPRS